MSDVQQRFLEDIANHKIRIVKDDGVHRFVRFAQPGSNEYWFDLVTWPGVLCISGDCGTFVFSRTHDMFEFFNEKRINPKYWAEKIMAGADHEQFSETRFRANVSEYFDNHTEHLPIHIRLDLWTEIVDDVLYYADDKFRAETAAHDFSYLIPKDGDSDVKSYWQFEDFFEYRNKEYTHSYLWCCHAIVWGIEQYNKAKEQA